ncbi:hypothetical protein DYB32_005283 [Aphanomyces invadans]|nr:hypothetical protein DYB32_005283 [Aphanomyces invadans]
MNMMLPAMLAPEFPHMIASRRVEVDGFTFQDPNQPSMDFDFDNDEDAAKDVDDFTSLLSSIDDDETARDIDEFAALMNVLAKSQEESVSDLSEVSIEDLMTEQVFVEAEDVLVNPDTKDDEEMESDYDSDDDDFVPPSPVYSAPHSFLAPIDPRCCIQSSIFKSVDSRIPMINPPKMDVSFGRVSVNAVCTKADMTCLARSLSFGSAPSSPGSMCSADSNDTCYVHESDKCWVCKSDKSEERKRVLHRYVEKRYRRNWKRGARYTARSRVASSRVREGGRFVTKCDWVAANEI